MPLKRILPYVWFPALFALAISGFAGLLALDQPPALAAYLPTVIVGLLIVLLEFHFPEREEWRPRWADVKADATFLALVQILLPQALAAVTVIAIAGWMHERLANGWWPHAWPLWVQVAVVVLAVDFMRYWLHRACHYFMPLWKLHEVHHSPEILYVLNVGRFHPFEKTLHFSLDTVPFLLLGVGPEVIAGYFLMYSVNGLFQHCNVRLRYGWLNYIVGSAETHRWHHARDPQTAACNFGNTTIVWDLIFGTWRLDRNTAVEIGIPDQTYPQSFWAQMLAPFGSGSRSAGQSWSGRLTALFIGLRLRIARMMHVRRMGACAGKVRRMQETLLRRLLVENRETTFGREHGFAAIRTYEEFVQRVPVNEHEELRRYIDAQIERRDAALTNEKPVHYVRTSGTTGKPKDLPLTLSHLRSLRRIQRAALAFQHRACPRAFRGSILGIVGPAKEGTLANGIPFGAASGIVAADSPAIMRERFVVPPEVFAIPDSRVKYLLILRLGIARPDVSYIGSANPSTLLALIRLYREHREALLDDLRSGSFFLASELSPAVRQAVRERLRANPARAAELAARGATSTRIADLWPELRVVSTWTCASAGIAAEALRQELPAGSRMLELGYIASEFRGTITLGRNAGTGWPTCDTHFFEFVERDRWDDGKPEFLTLDQVRKGVTYYVIVTTPSGLYRYFINDLVEVCGYFRGTPLLKFMQKGRGVTSITGEKLYEAQVLVAVKTAMATFGRSIRFIMTLADEAAGCYRLYVEADDGPRPASSVLGETVDRRLGDLNVEYEAKRESGRLGPLIAAWLVPNAGEAHKQFCIQRGQRDGQFKTVALTYRRRFDFDLDSLVDTGT
jgi:sterol desaturase/sphingolipid hydroxylase (fatty acid hydroxylase superfamily)